MAGTGISARAVDGEIARRMGYDNFERTFGKAPAQGTVVFAVGLCIQCAAKCRRRGEPAMIGCQTDGLFLPRSRRRSSTTPRRLKLITTSWCFMPLPPFTGPRFLKRQ